MSDLEWRFRPGMELIYTLQPGEQYRFYDGGLVVTHPERPPKIVSAMGVFEVDLAPPRT